METESKESEAQVVIYSDGACRGNPGVGAYGAVIVSGGVEEEISGAEAETTNNRMELTAAIRAFESLKGTFKVHVITDSQYVKRGMTEWIDGWIRRGWRKSANKPVLNRDLWERLLEVTREHTVTWEWVRGHAGHTYNERCDQLANQAIDRFLHR